MRVNFKEKFTEIYSYGSWAKKKRFPFRCNPNPS